VVFNLAERPGSGFAQLPLVLSFGAPSRWILELSWTYAWTTGLVDGDFAGSAKAYRFDSARFVASFGYVVRPLGGGFVVIPKVLTAVGLDGLSWGQGAADAPTPALNQRVGQAALGLDVGYQWSIERLRVSLVAGAAVGVATGVPFDVSPFSTAIPPVGSVPGASSTRMVVDLNLNLLRIGVAF